MAETSQTLSLAAKAGHILLENGAEISRVEETMERIAEHYGEKGENFFVLSNGIFTTGRSYSKVEFIPIKGARLDKVAAVNQLSREIVSENLSAEEAERRLNAIDKSPEKPAWEQLAATALGCAGFCAIFGGGFADCAASVIAGVILYCFILFFGMRFLSKPLSNICGGLIATAACILLYSMGLGHSLGNIIIGAVIPLIPGVAFTNGLRDLAGEDYLAGTIRLLDALMVFFCIAFGVCLAFIVHSWTAGGMIQLNGTMTDSGTYSFLVQMASAFIGTGAFAVLFGVPRKHYTACGIVGMLGWMVYLLIFRYTQLSFVGGTFFATLVVALLSHYCARLRKCPSTIFLICGIFPLIPGAGVFWSSYYTVSEQLRQAMDSGFTAVKVTIAIVLGIIIVTNIFNGKHQ